LAEIRRYGVVTKLARMREPYPSALSDISAMVETFIAEWQKSDLLPSEVAPQLVANILRHKRVKEAAREVAKSASQIGGLTARGE
jgi:hypothetical protein